MRIISITHTNVVLPETKGIHKKNVCVLMGGKIHKYLNNLKYGYFASTVHLHFCIGLQQTTVSSIGPDELPPPYQQASQSGVPMVTCRVCQAMIDITNKREQHVVKCNQCNEATVNLILFLNFVLNIIFFFSCLYLAN